MQIVQQCNIFINCNIVLLEHPEGAAFKDIFGTQIAKVPGDAWPKLAGFFRRWIM